MKIWAPLDQEQLKKLVSQLFIIRNECSSERMVRGTKGPGFIRSRERMFPGTNGPGNESFLRMKLPPWERIVLGTNSLENECSTIPHNIVTS